MIGFTRPATHADIAPLVADLREADLAEIKASFGGSPELSLTLGINNGEARVACLPNGLPAAIYGAVPLHSDETVGVVWMVATNSFQLLHRQFLRESREEIADLCRGYRAVFNFTDARNTLHHRWIKWSGFTIIKRHEEFGAEKRPFLEFVRITEDRHV